MEASKNRIPLQISGGIVTVPIRYELTHQILEHLRIDLLDLVDKHKHAFAVVFDLNGVKILDEDNFNTLQKTIKMLSVMGLKAMLCGLAPGVVSTILDMDIDMRGLRTTFDLNMALTKLNKERNDIV